MFSSLPLFALLGCGEAMMIMYGNLLLPASRLCVCWLLDILDLNDILTFPKGNLFIIFFV